LGPLAPAALEGNSRKTGRGRESAPGPLALAGLRPASLAAPNAHPKTRRQRIRSRAPGAGVRQNDGQSERFRRVLAFRPVERGANFGNAGALRKCRGEIRVFGEPSEVFCVGEAVGVAEKRVAGLGSGLAARAVASGARGQTPPSTSALLVESCGDSGRDGGVSPRAERASAGGNPGFGRAFGGVLRRGGGGGCGETCGRARLGPCGPSCRFRREGRSGFGTARRRNA